MPNQGTDPITHSESYNRPQHQPHYGIADVVTHGITDGEPKHWSEQSPDGIADGITDGEPEHWSERSPDSIADGITDGEPEHEPYLRNANFITYHVTIKVSELEPQHEPHTLSHDMSVFFQSGWLCRRV